MAQARAEIIGMKEYYAKAVQVPWCLLLPESKNMQRWDVATVLALFFTAVVTPYEVALLETRPDGLFMINRLVDLIFLADMIANVSDGFSARCARPLVITRDPLACGAVLPRVPRRDQGWRSRAARQELQPDPLPLSDHVVRARLCLVHAV